MTDETTEVVRRPNKHQYGMILVRDIATRATCHKTVNGVGCVLMDAEGRILATGYNGSVPGAPHCDDVGHLLMDGHCVRTVHAEANAIADAARRGTAIKGATAYLTMLPCHNCVKLMSTAGIKTVIFADFYKGNHLEDDHPAYRWLIEHSGINFQRMPWDVVDHRGLARHLREGDNFYSTHIAVPEGEDDEAAT